MESFNDYLRQFPHYQPHLFDDLRPHLSILELDAGDYFLQYDKVCKSIAFIERGLIRLYYLNDGKEVTHCFCRENNITTSYRSLVTKERSEIAIQAIEPTRLIVLPYDALQELYAKDLFWQQVGRMAVEHEYISTESYNRMIRDYSAIDRYSQILEHDESLLQRVPLNYLATYLQVTPETLSRIRKKLSRT